MQRSITGAATMATVIILVVGVLPETIGPGARRIVRAVRVNRAIPGLARRPRTSSVREAATLHLRR